MNLIQTYSGALILCLAAPACTIDKNLLGEETGETASSEAGSASAGELTTGTTGETGAPTSEPGAPTSEPGSETGESDSETGEPDGDDTSGTGTGTTDATTEDVPAECAIDTGVVPPFFTTTAMFKVDEVCVLTGATVDESQLLTFDCPQHAATWPGVPVEFKLESGPLPAGLVVGASLAVYYQVGDFEGFMEDPNPELLFLRDDEGLLYGSIRGYFRRAEDFDLVAEKAAPFTVKLVAGRCEHVSTGQDTDGDGTSCIKEAVSQVEVTGDAVVVLAEGSIADVQAGPRSYTADQRLARHGEDCIDLAELIRYQLALALQP